MRGAAWRVEPSRVWAHLEEKRAVLARRKGKLSISSGEGGLIAILYTRGTISRAMIFALDSASATIDMVNSSLVDSLGLVRNELISNGQVGNDRLN